MLRVEVSEAGQAALPAIDVDGEFAIGSGPAARVRLPARVLAATVVGGGPAILAEHVRVAAGEWRALGDARVAGAPASEGAIGDGVTLEIGAYRVRIAPAPAGVAASPPQRTESLARELIRNLMGDAAPVLEVERGPVPGARRALAAPPSRLVIGRGDEAEWVIVDEDVSRMHAEVRRGWDGVVVADLDSKNGTRVDGIAAGGAGLPLRDGALVELGKVLVRFRDPAERHLRGEATPTANPAPAPPPVAAPPPVRGRTPAFYVALAIMALALAGLTWLATLR